MYYTYIAEYRQQVFQGRFIFERESAERIAGASQLRGDDFINCYTTQLIRHLSNEFEAARKGLCPGGKGNRVRAGG